MDRKKKKERTVVNNPPKEIILTDNIAKGNEANEKERREKVNMDRKRTKSKFV